MALQEVGQLMIPTTGGTQPVNVSYPISGNGLDSNPIRCDNISTSEPTYTLLWSATNNAQQANNTSISLVDSIDNYDELVWYGSGTRNAVVSVATEYPVIPGKVNLGGPFYCGKWGQNDTWLLCNGTQCWVSGTSGYVASSYYWGKVDGGTSAAAAWVNNRTNDVRPYKLVGVKY